MLNKIKIKIVKLFVYIMRQRDLQNDDRSLIYLKSEIIRWLIRNSNVWHLFNELRDIFKINGNII